MTVSKPLISIVLPCLNEEHTLKMCLDEIHAVCKAHDLNYEIVVADNNSTDKSPSIAQENGARVAKVVDRGYGCAVNGGILAAKGDIAIMADCDFSYPFGSIPDLIAPILADDADIVLGNRLKLPMEKGAMPTLNRFVGTPMLSALIRWLYNIPVYDCNGGMRAIRTSIYPTLKLKQPGMEYASEMLLRAGITQIRYKEVPIPFRKHAKGHVPYLNPIRDGLRHLKTILAGKFHAS